MAETPRYRCGNPRLVFDADPDRQENAYGDKLIEWLAQEYEVPYEVFFVLDGGKTKRSASG
jgi:hypothetical protein